MEISNGKDKEKEKEKSYKKQAKGADDPNRGYVQPQ